MHRLLHYLCNQTVTFVTMDETILTHQNHPKSIVILGFTLGVVYSMGLALIILLSVSAFKC